MKTALSIPSEWLTDGKEYACMIVPDYAGYPHYLPGDQLILNTSDAAEHGDAVAARDQNGRLIIGTYYIGTKRTRIDRYSAIYPPCYDFKIIGKIAHMVRSL